MLNYSVAELRYFIKFVFCHNPVCFIRGNSWSGRNHLKKKFIGAINVHLDVEVGMNAELL